MSDTLEATRKKFERFESLLHQYVPDIAGRIALRIELLELIRNAERDLISDALDAMKMKGAIQ